MGELARRLALAAEQRQLTDAEAAAFFDVDQTAFTRWKLGRVIPGSKRAAALAEFIGVERAQVLEWLADDERTPPGSSARFAAIEARLAELEAWRAGLSPAATPAQFATAARTKDGGQPPKEPGAKRSRPSPEVGNDD